MYDLLRRFLPPRAAGAALVLWYAALLLAILFCLHAPDSPFRYGNL